MNLHSSSPHELTPPSSQSLRYAVIGGGMLGMTVAKRLAEQGHRVTLFEAADHLGGLADAWQIDSITWDRHYHVTLLSDQHNREMLRDLDLESDMQWVVTKTGFFTDGKLYSMSNSLEFLRFPPLSLLSKMRLGWTIFYGSKIRNWKRLEKIPVADWLSTWSGKKTFEKIWLPLLRSKLGENYRKTSAAFIWATIARLYAARRSGLKQEMFGYLPGSYQRINRAFTAKLRSLGVDLHLSCKVTKISKSDQGSLDVKTLNQVSGAEQAQESSDQFDQVVVTLPSSLVTKICDGLSESECKAHSEIEYQSLVCASVVLKEPISDFYVTNITDPAPFTGIIEMTAMVPKETFGNHSLVYLPKYVPAGDLILRKGDAEIEEEFLSSLDRMYDHFSRDNVVAFKVSRVPHVMSISTLGYSDALPPMKTTVDGLYVVNSAQIVNGTLNVNETIGLAHRAVNELLLPDAVRRKTETHQ